MVDGDQSLRSVAGDLPYLLKVLAATDPLSLQTHPTRQQAEQGFAREERDGPEVDASTRLYRDPRPKPELLCALTPFDALCGFRPVAASIDLLRSFGIESLADRLAADGLAATVTALYDRLIDLAPIIEACKDRPEPEAQLVDELALQYRGDPSVVVTLLLNRITLAPNEAIFLGPGNLHAYLSGAGVEIMGASDNVIRGGLTPKHVDVPSLLQVLSIEPLDDPLTVPTELGAGRWCYDTPETPFRLWRWQVEGGISHTSTGHELLLCTDGDTDRLHMGEVAYLAPHEPVTLIGTATVFRVEECKLAPDH